MKAISPSLALVGVVLLAASQTLCQDVVPAHSGGKTKCPFSKTNATCPITGAQRGENSPMRSLTHHKLDLRVLQRRSVGPLGANDTYARAFSQLDVKALKRDVMKLMESSQDWWPADYGHYGPLFIRLAWHSAGTYRAIDGRGGASSGAIRFAPLNSWPDNMNLDKAVRLLWPIKQKYGRKISWADLIVFSGNCALESMGFKTVGFGFGRQDAWAPEDVDWGPEKRWLEDKRHTNTGDLQEPLAAAQMGLIYVNPEGPGGKPDPLAAAKAIRVTFGRMSMNDQETVALIAGGHSFGKAHGAANPRGKIGPEPDVAPLELNGLGWRSRYKSGKGDNTITSGLEGAWTSTPTRWSHGFLDNLFNYNWRLIKGPGGAWQWTPKEKSAQGTVPDAFDPQKSHAPMMFTTDLALRFDPAYSKIARRFHKNPKEFAAAFANAWYKLIHRDMGPRQRLLGPWVPEAQLWQDPVPKVDYKLIDSADIAALKRTVLSSGLPVADLVGTAWSSASTYRRTDRRGGANGARIRLAPQKSWQVNNPKRLDAVLKVLTGIQRNFNEAQTGDKRISLADLIVLAGAAAIEKAAKDAGYRVVVPFTPGRSDASSKQTDTKSFAVLEPTSDGFRNYHSKRSRMPAINSLVDHADRLTLSAPEMTVLLGGMRVLNVNYPKTGHGVLTARDGQLTNDFFVNLLDMSTKWRKAKDVDGLYEGRDRKSGKRKWTATPVDLVFTSNSQLRAISEFYASADAKERFVKDFVAAWVKVMRLDRFDLKSRMK